MPLKRRELTRPTGEREYKKLFIIAVEGAKTEHQYFTILKTMAPPIIQIKCLKGNKSSPHYVLKTMKNHLKEEQLKETDEAWLVVDKDNWQDEQLNKLHDWSKTRDNYGFALSNPKFEYWLLLHFEAGHRITSSRDCSERLKKYLPDYNKSIEANQIDDGMITTAIKRAKQLDNPPSDDWPRKTGTTVYKLVERIIWPQALKPTAI
ncbi:MAG: RloB family protein [Candidatus Magnetoovum sp. WYHC-5]|nr:RloB family protein [Candidatus Magnetoovum sp. WYHC-5]